MFKNKRRKEFNYGKYNPTYERSLAATLELYKEHPTYHYMSSNFSTLLKELRKNKANEYKKGLPQDVISNPFLSKIKLVFMHAVMRFLNLNRGTSV